MKFTIFGQRITLIAERLKQQANAFSPSDNKSKKFLVALSEALTSAIVGGQKRPFTLSKPNLEKGSNLADFLTNPRRKKGGYSLVVETLDEIKMICSNAKEGQEEDGWEKRQVACRILVHEILKAFEQGDVGLFHMGDLDFLWREAERKATSEAEILEVVE